MMRKRVNQVQVWIIVAAAVLLGLPMYAQAASLLTTDQQRLELASDRPTLQMEALQEEVRRQLVRLPYYSVFDWVEAVVMPDGAVTLMGQVLRPTTKTDAGARVAKIEGANRVTNNIEVLPLSSMDDRLRLALYRTIYNFNSPLFRYGTQAVPPIHIVVINGRVTLKGIVTTPFDSQIAYMAARQVPGSFEVRNELRIEQQASE